MKDCVSDMWFLFFPRPGWLSRTGDKREGAPPTGKEQGLASSGWVGEKNRKPALAGLGSAGEKKEKLGLRWMGKNAEDPVLAGSEMGGWKRAWGGWVTSDLTSLWMKGIKTVLSLLILTILAALAGGVAKTFLDLRLLLHSPLEVALRHVIIDTLILLAVVEVFKTTLTYFSEGRVKVTFIVDTILVVMLTEIISHWFKGGDLVQFASARRHLVGARGDARPRRPIFAGARRGTPSLSRTMANGSGRENLHSSNLSMMKRTSHPGTLDNQEVWRFGVTLDPLEAYAPEEDRDSAKDKEVSGE